MEERRHQNCLVKWISSVIQQALKAKSDKDSSERHTRDFTCGMVMGFYSIISLLQQQALAFDIDQEKLGLTGIKPEADLLDLRENRDMESAKEDRRGGELTEKAALLFLGDLTLLLYDQAMVVRRRANPKQAVDKSYDMGELAAYYKVISTMKHLSSDWDLEEKDINLADIDPEEDGT